MRFGRRSLPILVAVVIALIAVPALAAVALTRVSTDPYTNTASQHQTEVEPDTFSFGSTIVSAFRSGGSSAAGRPTLAGPARLMAAPPGPTGSCPGRPPW